MPKNKTNRKDKYSESQRLSDGIAWHLFGKNRARLRPKKHTGAHSSHDGKIHITVVKEDQSSDEACHREDKMRGRRG